MELGIMGNSDHAWKFGQIQLKRMSKNGLCLFHRGLASPESLANFHFAVTSSYMDWKICTEWILRFLNLYGSKLELEICVSLRGQWGNVFLTICLNYPCSSILKKLEFIHKELEYEILIHWRFVQLNNAFGIEPQSWLKLRLMISSVLRLMEFFLLKTIIVEIQSVQ